MKALTITALAMMFVGGCARYEFELVSPPDLAVHVGEKREEVVRVDPLEYRLQTGESRLVMNVFNPTDEPITLAGERSYVVDPKGQSHPLRPQTIAPRTYVKLILPPMRPGYYRSGPTIGLGFGFAYGHRHSGYGAGLGFPLYDPYFDEPRYVTYYDESDATYWSWEGETDVRLHLVYLRGKDSFSDDFTFHRKKV